MFAISIVRVLPACSIFVKDGLIKTIVKIYSKTFAWDIGRLALLYQLHKLASQQPITSNITDKSARRNDRRLFTAGAESVGAGHWSSTSSTGTDLEVSGEIGRGVLANARSA